MADRGGRLGEWVRRWSPTWERVTHGRGYQQRSAGAYSCFPGDIFRQPRAIRQPTPQCVQSKYSYRPALPSAHSYREGDPRLCASMTRSLNTDEFEFESIRLVATVTAVHLAELVASLTPGVSRPSEARAREAAPGM